MDKPLNLDMVINLEVCPICALANANSGTFHGLKTPCELAMFFTNRPFTCLIFAGLHREREILYRRTKFMLKAETLKLTRALNFYDTV